MKLTDSITEINGIGERIIATKESGIRICDTGMHKMFVTGDRKE